MAERIELSYLSEPERQIVERMRGMEMNDPMQAALSLIRSICHFHIRTQAGEETWQQRHDRLAQYVIDLLDAGQSCPKDVLERVRGQHD